MEDCGQRRGTSRRGPRSCSGTRPRYIQHSLSQRSGQVRRARCRPLHYCLKRHSWRSRGVLCSCTASSLPTTGRPPVHRWVRPIQCTSHAMRPRSGHPKVVSTMPSCGAPPAGHWVSIDQELPYVSAQLQTFSRPLGPDICCLQRRVTAPWRQPPNSPVFASSATTLWQLRWAMARTPSRSATAASSTPKPSSASSASRFLHGTALWPA